MASEPKTIEVEPGSALDCLLAEAGGAPLRLIRGDERFRLDREADEDDVWADYDPERARAGMRAAAGAWKDLDAESTQAFIYRAREEGTRPPDEPRGAWSTATSRSTASRVPVAPPRPWLPSAATDLE